MSDWNEQAAPNNNTSSETIGTSKLVGGKEELQGSVKDNEGLTELSDQNKNREDLSKHLLSRQPGM
jgi:hypothetical protein